MASLIHYLWRALSGIPLRRKKLATYNMNWPLLLLSRFPWGDCIRAYEVSQGVLVMGTVGAGKTSGTGAYLASGLLRNGWGGLILSAKPDEVMRWQKYVEAAGRTDDLYIFSPPHSQFNFLNHALQQGDGHIENLVDLFLKATEVLNRHKGGGMAGDSYWDNAMRFLVRNTVSLVTMAQDSLSLLDIHQVIVTAPDNPAAVDDAVWRERSVCFAMLQLARQRLAQAEDTTALQQHDLEQVETFFLRDWSALNPRTRTSIVSVFTSLADGFLHGELFQTFCGDTNVDLTSTHRGGLILLNLPTERYGAFSLIAQTLIKYCWQQTTRRREVSASSPGAFIWADEANFFCSSSDVQFNGIARERRAGSIYLSQSIPGWYNAVGKTVADGFLSHFNLRFFHVVTDVTATWAADTIGKDVHKKKMRAEVIHPTAWWKILGRGITVTNSVTESYEYLVPPVAFLGLRNGGRLNRFKVDAFIFRAGKKFNKTGANFIKVQYRQNRVSRYIRTIRTEHGKDVMPLQRTMRAVGIGVWLGYRIVRGLVLIILRLFWWIIRGSRSGRGR